MKAGACVLEKVLQNVSGLKQAVFRVGTYPVFHLSIIADNAVGMFQSLNLFSADC